MSEDLIHISLEGILERLRLKTKSEFNTRVQEIVHPYLKEIVWKNETLEDDLATFFVLVYGYRKRHTEYELKNILEWMRGKNLAPLQAYKALRR